MSILDTGVEYRVYSLVTTRDPIGGMKNSWKFEKVILGIFQERTGSTGVSNSRRYLETGSFIYCMSNPEVSEGWRITRENDTYLVLNVVDQASRHIVWRIQVSKEL